MRSLPPKPPGPVLLSRALVVTALASGCSAAGPPREGQPHEVLPPREGPPPMDIGPPREGPPPYIDPREGPPPAPDPCQVLTVTNQAGEPLADVEVTLSDGTTLRTDQRGSVNVPPMQGSMRLRHPGYEPLENVDCGRHQLRPKGEVLVPAEDE